MRHLFIVILFLTSANVFAQKSASKEVFKPHFDQSLDMSYSTNLYKTTEADEVQAASFEYGFQDVWHATHQWGISVQYSYDFKDSEKSEINFLSATARQNKLWRVFGGHWSLTETISAPVSEQKRIDEEITALGLSFIYDRAIGKMLSLNLKLSANKKFHKYETNISGRMNTSWNNSESLTLDWNVLEKLSFSVRGTHLIAWPYAGDNKHFVSHSETVTYQLHKELALYLSHEFGSPFAPLYTPNGEELNLQVTDDYASFITAGFDFSF